MTTHGLTRPHIVHVVSAHAISELKAAISLLYRPYSMNDELHLFTFNWNRINGIPPVLVY